MYQKASSVAIHLGKSDDNKYVEEIKYIERKGLRQTFCVNLEVYRLVFSQTNYDGYLGEQKEDVRAYISGVWENHLDELYSKAQLREAETKRGDRLAQEAQMRRNFGIYDQQ